jgi:predicted O-methyltransferase YrrM
LIYIDCDLYSSTKEAFEWIRPYLQTGTIICFDDYFTFSGDADKGGQRALREFAEKYPEFSFLDWLLFGWAGKSFIVNRRGGLS